MQNKKIVRIAKTLLISANTLALVILHSRLAVAILTFTMWSSCPVNCECINCNLYFDVCCNLPTPTQTIKTRKIAAKFFNMLSSPSLSADVDLVSSSTNLHAPSTKTDGHRRRLATFSRARHHSCHKRAYRAAMDFQIRSI